ncbi:MAG: selenide, water dikinase SelD [Sandaracinus sp.]
MTDAVRLTRLAKRAGCAAKQPPGTLLPLLARLPAVRDPRVLVGSATADDAAVVRVTDTLALVSTTDFFTPIVDDPYDFGAIAAANALSDVYAMGGTPLSALNLVGFPSESLDLDVLGRILLGGADKAHEAGIDIVGGHTIQTDEPIYGLAVTGTIDPQRVLTNATARPGDALVLTKPIGLGIVTTAAKRDEDDLGAIGEAIALMKTLNRDAADAMREAGASAATDVTGFGLLGHLRNVVAASGVGATIWASEVPVLAAARAYVARGIAPGGTHANLRFLGEHVSFDDDVSKDERLLLADAQTSGGLLIAIAEERVPALLRGLAERGTPAAAVVGTIHAEEPRRIRVQRRRA